MSKSKALKEVEVADSVFAALAHPARRQILLSVHYRGASNAGEIANRVECSWPTTSRHLATLVASGLLDVEVIGRERIYKANARRVQSVLSKWAGYFD